MIPPTESQPYLESLARLASSIDGDNGALARIGKAIEQQPSLLDDPSKLRRIFVEELQGVDWRWPWLERWRETFASMGAWPRLWRGPMPDAAVLLHHSMLTGRRLEFRYGFVKFARPLSDEPPEIIELVGAKIAAYAAGDAGVGLPPYFPGDRTRATPSLPGMARRHPDQVIVPFLGYGSNY